MHVGPKWIPGKISAVLGSRHFEVKLNDCRIVKRHLDHVCIQTNDVVELPASRCTAEMHELITRNTYQLTHSCSTPPKSQVYRSTHNRRPPNRYDPVSS